MLPMPHLLKRKREQMDTEDTEYIITKLARVALTPNPKKRPREEESSDEKPPKRMHRAGYKHINFLLREAHFAALSQRFEQTLCLL